ncbi:Uu.00g109660.m01.CDS01 [Anthostomella pinea]|uniref:Uu.00g109660.m01.CDS01 n=1 Tax=Anthostomella pinea TaxID=933095 RepID=A0AAI8VER7_9PEZI|nr:Uu.00g109660.m01.CDS01 [Anthostomella pinea]
MDFTWLSVQPTLWQQISYGFSIITACVPSLKVIFDGVLNDHVGFGMPYQLEPLAGRAGFQVITRSEDHELKTKSSAVSRNRRGDEDLKLTPSLLNRANCYTGKSSRPADKRHKDNGERKSVQNLTGAVIVVRNEFDDERGWSSGGSH